MKKVIIRNMKKTVKTRQGFGGGKVRKTTTKTFTKGPQPKKKKKAIPAKSTTRIARPGIPQFHYNAPSVNAVFQHGSFPKATKVGGQTMYVNWDSFKKKKK